MPSLQKLVILFTRYPVAGKCKTRLIPALGAEGAVRIHQQLVSHILREINTFISSRKNTEFALYYDADSLQQMQDWLGRTYTYKKQQGYDLGQRMADALIHDGISSKKNSILIGSDCPGINSSILNEGFEALKQNDIVLGPAYDGGYYLIGVADTIQPAACRQLFEQIPWGTDKVLTKTLVQTQKLGLRHHLLSRLHDIDTPEDLKHFHHCSHPE